MPFTSLVRQMSPFVSTHQPQPPAMRAVPLFGWNSSAAEAAVAVRIAPDPVAGGGQFGTCSTGRARPAMKRWNREFAVALHIEAIDLQVIGVHVGEIQERAAVELSRDRHARPLVDVNRVVRILEAARPRKPRTSSPGGFDKSSSKRLLPV